MALNSDRTRDMTVVTVTTDDAEPSDETQDELIRPLQLLLVSTGSADDVCRVNFTSKGGMNNTDTFRQQ